MVRKLVHHPQFDKLALVPYGLGGVDPRVERQARPMSLAVLPEPSLGFKLRCLLRGERLDRRGRQLAKTDPKRELSRRSWAACKSTAASG